MILPLFCSESLVDCSVSQLSLGKRWNTPVHQRATHTQRRQPAMHTHSRGILASLISLGACSCWRKPGCCNNPTQPQKNMKTTTELHEPGIKTVWNIIAMRMNAFPSLYQQVQEFNTLPHSLKVHNFPPE